jgi:phosphoglycerate dehydrogenase-like enzyme
MNKGKTIIWIIDEEWSDYKDEQRLLQQEVPNAIIRCSSYDYAADLEAFGYEADIILAQIYAEIPAKVIARLEKCKGIAVYGGGYDRVDIAAARAKGISVTNVNGYCIEDIAEYVLAAILYGAKQLTAYDAAIENGEWGAQAVHAPIHRLTGQTLFIVGCGRIGSFAGQKAKALGMRVTGYDPFVTVERMSAVGIDKVSLEEGFRTADFVSVHIKCDETTENLLTRKYFSLMKPSAYLINTSRGRILNEGDLITAVKKKHIAGAVLDVITEEPPNRSGEIFHVPGILVTPHISYISEESYEELKRRTIDNALAMLRGQRPADLVN